MGPYVPPGHSPPFQVVDDLHHGAWVIIAVALGLVLSLVSFLIRLYVRLALHPPFAYDDYVLLGATVIAVIQAALLFSAVSRGLGTSIEFVESDQLDTVQTLVGISDILYLITLYTTKCCVVGIYFRLTPQKLHNRASWATLILCTLWLVPAVLITTINCGFNRPWAGSSCENILSKWQFIVALDIATELILFGLAVWLLAGLFMSLKRKFTIAFAFVFRLPMVIFAILHIYDLHRNFRSDDRPLAAVRPVIWAQVELNYALIACSVFCLRPFMAAVSTNYGTAGDSTLESSQNHPGSKSSASASASGNRGTVSCENGGGSDTAAFGALRSGCSKLCVRGARSAGRGRDRRSIWQGIELVDRGKGEGVARDGVGQGGPKMFIRKDVQYSVEYNGLGSDEGAGVNNEMVFWDQYLDKQPS